MAAQITVSAAFAPGPDVRLVDLSRGGARFECERRLLPGSTVALRLLTAEGPVVVRGQVVRSRIAKIDQQGLAYEVAVAFNETLTALDEPPEEPVVAASEPPAPAESQADHDIVRPEEIITTVSASVSQSRHELREIFNGNHW